MPKKPIKQKHFLDKFYTKQEEADRLLSLIDLDEYDLVIEPSAGKGAFINNLNHPNVIAYDISPDNNNVIKHNWFDVIIDNTYNNVCIVGNPPFGTRNTLSKKFIKHALSFDNVSTIAFILPKVWRKPTLQKTFPEEWSLVADEQVSENAFLFNDESYNINTVFQIWKKNTNESNLRWGATPSLTHNDFEFSDINNGDFFVMGAAPKTIKEKDEVKSNNRGYWIKSHIDINQLKNNIKTIEWDKWGCSSVSGGVYWISKAEFISIYSNKENQNES